MSIDDEPGSPLMRIVGIFTLTLFAIMSVGYIVGYSQAALEHGHSPLALDFVLTNSIGIFVLVASLGGIYQLARPLMRRGPTAKPLAQSRAGRMKIFWIGLIGMSVVIGAGFALWDMPEGPAKITPRIAILTAIIAALLLVVVDRFYRANVDEVELSAGKEASYWAVNIYAVAMPIGWMFWQAGILDAMPSWSIYIIVIVAFNTIFLWKRFR